MVAHAYERWSLTRGSKYSDLTWKLLVFCKTGRRGEVVATGDLTVVIKVYSCSMYSCKRVFKQLWTNENWMKYVVGYPEFKLGCRFSFQAKHLEYCFQLRHESYSQFVFAKKKSISLCLPRSKTKTSCDSLNNAVMLSTSNSYLH